MALLIVALIITAMIPVLTKKYRTIGNHGRWECTLDEHGKHKVRMVYGGKDTGFKLAGDGSSCTFTPPANAENFSVKVIGGGGSGAGGQPGDMTDQQFEANEFILPVTAPFNGDFSIELQGGGGAGGGMKCGFASDNVFSTSKLQFTPEHAVSECSRCVAHDVAVSDFDYSRLFKNDKSAYQPYAETEKELCFAEKDWTNELKDDDKCWNYPGFGGGAMSPARITVSLMKGDRVTLTPADGGAPGQPGEPGGNGASSCYQTSKGEKRCQAGGAGGANRYVMQVTYKNIPVTYVVEQYFRCCVEDNPTYPCPDICDDKGENCVPSTETCGGGCKTYSDDCKKTIRTERQTRNNYFSIPSCVNDGALPRQNADEPGLLNTTVENGDVIGGAGSGGRGAGRQLIENAQENSLNIYSGESGSSGYARLSYVTYSGGSGGKAGSYVYSLYKKLPTVSGITIGRGGSGNVDFNNDGQSGLETKFGTLLKAQGGEGGRAMVNYPDLTAGETTAVGGDGSPSPLDSGLFKKFIVAYGGLSEHNSDISGYSVSTYVWKIISSISVGGALNQYTYGAGGGGGGGKRGAAGTGGAGAPGAVIVEW